MVDKAEKSNLWLVFVLFFFIFGFFTPAIAVELVKYRKRKPYSEFNKSDYVLAIWYSLGLGVLLYAFAFLIGFWLSVFIYFIVFVASWIATRNIKPSKE